MRSWTPRGRAAALQRAADNNIFNRTPGQMPGASSPNPGALYIDAAPIVARANMLKRNPVMTAGPHLRRLAQINAQAQQQAQRILPKIVGDLGVFARNAGALGIDVPQPTRGGLIHAVRTHDGDFVRYYKAAKKDYNHGSQVIAVSSGSPKSGGTGLSGQQELKTGGSGSVYDALLAKGVTDEDTVLLRGVRVTFLLTELGGADEIEDSYISAASLGSTFSADFNGESLKTSGEEIIIQDDDIDGSQFFAATMADEPGVFLGWKMSELKADRSAIQVASGPAWLNVPATVKGAFTITTRWSIAK